MARPRQSAVFGRRKEPHTVIIARGSEIRHFTIRPWVAALVGSTVAAVAIGYLLATTYLVLRDDLIGATVARQARMQQAYEDRISALRAQVDRITSRQLLDQQLMESKVTELLDRQTRLAQRQSRLDPILQRAGKGHPDLPAVAPTPQPKPDIRAEADVGVGTALRRSDAADFSAPRRLLSAFLGPDTIAGPESAADRADRLFVAVNQSLRSIETEQLTRVRSLTENAWQTTEEIAEALQSAGLTIEADYGEGGTGGPLLMAEEGLAFDAEVRELDEALERLDAIKEEARKLPIANPAPGRAISSSFGMRRDPILGTPAYHSGMDFRAPTGSPVRAAGPGTVVSAGWNGGYGRMVEIDHGNGYSSRYAHMRAIQVREGETVDAGTVLGQVGSSGRSTGPHLHYEVRREGDALDPLRFIKVGRKIAPFL